MLSQSGQYSFGEYASFLMTYPDWPNGDDMRKNAEQAINLASYSPNQAVAYFDRLPPLTNGGRAKYAGTLCHRQCQGAQNSGPAVRGVKAR